MSLKKEKIIIIISVFLICFPFHFIYDKFPCFYFSIFFPVNESVFEHIKMVNTALLVGALLEYFILRKFNLKYHNFGLSVFFSLIGNILFFILIYFPIYLKFGENFVFNIICLIISVIISQIISYYIMKFNKLNLNLIALTLIIILCTFFGLLTYYPLENPLFLDSENNKYGILMYLI